MLRCLWRPLGKRRRDLNPVRHRLLASITPLSEAGSDGLTAGREENALVSS